MGRKPEPQKNMQVSVSLPPHLVAAIEDLRRKQIVVPSRSAVIQAALEHFFE